MLPSYYLFEGVYCRPPYADAIDAIWRNRFYVVIYLFRFDLIIINIDKTYCSWVCQVIHGGHERRVHMGL